MLHQFLALCGSYSLFLLSLILCLFISLPLPKLSTAWNTSYSSCKTHLLCYLLQEVFPDPPPGWRTPLFPREDFSVFPKSPGLSRSSQQTRLKVLIYAFSLEVREGISLFGYPHCLAQVLAGRNFSIGICWTEAPFLTLKFVLPEIICWLVEFLCTRTSFHVVDVGFTPGLGIQNLLQPDEAIGYTEADGSLAFLLGMCHCGAQHLSSLVLFQQ